MLRNDGYNTYQWLEKVKRSCLKFERKSGNLDLNLINADFATGIMNNLSTLTLVCIKKGIKG